MAVNKVVYNAKVLLDLTSDTVTADKLANGVTAHDKSGAVITGTMACNSKSYELTIAKASGWVLLTTLDDEVLAHINDVNFKVQLSLLDVYEYVYYRMTYASASNVILGMQDSYPVYGSCIRNTAEGTIQRYYDYYPANKTDSSTSLGGFQFRLNGNKYYLRPYDGYLGPGKYRLTFTW